MTRISFALLLSIVFAGQVSAQDDILGKIAELKASEAKLFDRIGKVEAKVDAIAAKVDQLLGVKSVVMSDPSKAHSCTCGCVQTGVCTCPNCDVGCGLQPALPTQKPKQSSLPAGYHYETICNGGSCQVVAVPDDGTQSYQDQGQVFSGRFRQRLRQRWNTPFFSGRGGGGCQ